MPELKDKDKLKQKPEAPEKTETKTVAEIKEETVSDIFNDTERQEIIKMVRDDAEYSKQIQEEYISQKELDLKHYHSVKPSELEGLTKKTWQSDRNLGLARAIADSFQSVYLATCWNPDTINFVATNATEIDNRTNQEKFTKWGMGKQEVNMQPQVDDFIHNQIVVGSGFFKIYRKEWPEWVDRRIPKKNREGRTIRYEIKTEKVRFVKGVIENIPDIDDILLPEYGKDIQELPFFGQIIHTDGEHILNWLDRKVFKPKDKEEYKKKLHNHTYNEKKRVLGEEKLKNLGIEPGTIQDSDVRRIPIDLYEMYENYTKNGKNEKYRFIVDLVNEELLSGKPVRKINRSGKIPFAGGSILHEPGHIRGISYMQIIATVVNAFNNIYNQKSDFQYVENCPFGFYKPDEGYTQQQYELVPMVLYPTDDPSKVNIPNLSRSMAWAESDMRILFEVLERLTGAASYFSVGQQRNRTLGQDLLVDKQSETRFGLGATRIIEYICEAIGMWYELYQDYPPKNLAERVVGSDGKKLFENLSIETLRGDTNVQMTPDIVAGSRAYKKQLQLWTFNIAQQMVWLNPQINPQGNWDLCADTLREMLNLSDNDIKRYLGERPKARFDEAELDNEWFKFISGEDFDPPEGETALALQHLEGHMKQKEEKYHELDEEYKPNFDSHLFKTMVNAMKFMRNVQQEAIANRLASSIIMAQGGISPQPQATTPAGTPPATPTGIPEAGGQISREEIAGGIS